jgi:PAS domain S-box-containing protein
MPMKILVVDDSATDRVLIERILSEYDVLTACDGVDAMKQIDANSEIGLIILDLNMPRMNGFEVLEVLKSEEKYKGIRTIILTNYDELDSEIKGLELGAVDYIRKPIHLASLKTRVGIHLELIKTQQQLEQKLVEQRSTFDTIFNQAPIGISISYSSDSSNAISDVDTQINSIFEQIAGRTKEEMIELGWANITHPEDLEKDLEYYRKLKSGEIESYAMEKRFVRPDGSIVWVEMTVASLKLMGESEIAHIALLKDITRRKAIEENLKYSYEHDSWTGLYNRNYMENLLESDSRRGFHEKRAVVSINLSAMQSLTTTYGFHYTQELNKKIADILGQYCNGGRVLFNIYENRFAFYIKGYEDKNELTEFSEEIAKNLEPLLISERIGGGIGIVEIDEENGRDVDGLLKKLLITSERAIDIDNREIGICFYDAAIEEQMVREQEIKRALTEISADESCSRLFLQYQPIIDLKTDAIIGFEALSRLNIDKLGLVPPLEFIPIAEKTKLIVPIGRRIMLQAFRFLKRLNDLGHSSIGISINVSAIQLLRDDFASSLFRMIKDARVHPENICIEITESVVASNYEEMNRILGELSDSKIHIAIDDFGTGYSSLARERDLNVNCLKIDKSFINRLMYLKSEEAITSDIISMAHKLGHCVVAEGVEYQKQREYLERWGCDRIQGYLISKPLNEEAAIEFLKTYNHW